MSPSGKDSIVWGIRKQKTFANQGFKNRAPRTTPARSWISRRRRSNRVQSSKSILKGCQLRVNSSGILSYLPRKWQAIVNRNALVIWISPTSRRSWPKMHCSWTSAILPGREEEVICRQIGTQSPRNVILQRHKSYGEL